MSWQKGGFGQRKRIDFRIRLQRSERRGNAFRRRRLAQENLFERDTWRVLVRSRVGLEIGLEVALPRLDQVGAAVCQVLELLL